MERKHRLDEGQELIARNRARSHRRNVVRKTRLEIGQTFYLGLPTRVQHHFAGLPNFDFGQRGSPFVTGGAFPRKVGGENRTVTAGRRPWWPRMAGLQPLSTRAFGPRLRRLTALTALATRPLIATKRSTARCGQSVCKCHAEKFRSAIFARILTAVHTISGIMRSCRWCLRPAGGVIKRCAARIPATRI